MSIYGNESKQYVEWLMQDDLLGQFHIYSHAYVALPTDQSVLDGVNAGVRDTQGCWYPSGGDWPDDDWIVGEDGAGNYYVISKSGAYEGVFEYLHETLEKLPLAANLRGFYEYCIGIHRQSIANAT